MVSFWLVVWQRITSGFPEIASYPALPSARQQIMMKKCCAVGVCGGAAYLTGQNRRKP
ncbi:hypothetical protein HMPREF0880_04386 [Yokenella regensburgei ATCC 43003]|nr:hypothetical protein HMPREF0880_04386 [Yokenella regensburgei ATCC 43003]